MRRLSYAPSAFLSFSPCPLTPSLSPLFSSSFSFFSFLSQTAFSMRLLSSPFPFTFRLSVLNFSLALLFSPFSFSSALYIFLPHSLFFILLISNFLYAARSSFPICRPFRCVPYFRPRRFPAEAAASSFVSLLFAMRQKLSDPLFKARSFQVHPRCENSDCDSEIPRAG